MYVNPGKFTKGIPNFSVCQMLNQEVDNWKKAINSQNKLVGNLPKPCFDSGEFILAIRKKDFPPEIFQEKVISMHTEKILTLCS